MIVLGFEPFAASLHDQPCVGKSRYLHGSQWCDSFVWRRFDVELTDGLAPEVPQGWGRRHRDRGCRTRRLPHLDGTAANVGAKGHLCCWLRADWVDQSLAP